MRNAPKKPETAADLGHDLDLGDRLASLNWFAVKAVLGVLVRSLASANPPIGSALPSTSTDSSAC